MREARVVDDIDGGEARRRGCHVGCHDSSRLPTHERSAARRVDDAYDRPLLRRRAIQQKSKMMVEGAR